MPQSPQKRLRARLGGNAARGQFPAVIMVSAGAMARPHARARNSDTMLTEANNTTLTQTGAGTPMGDLLRRYWYPIAAVGELEEKPTKRVRLLGENLVLYKDLGGRYGLVDRHCPLRRADMTFGSPEECGLRCHYHGWLFDETGKCIEQPFDDTV